MWNRREVILGSLGLVVGLPRPALAGQDNGSGKLIEAFTGGKTPGEGKLSLTMPEIAENGNTVPLTVRVDSPMSPSDHVQEVLVVATGNPAPEVARFHFSPASGVAQADTRMRLAKTQDVVALARMSDGSLQQARTTVKVTIGGCGG